MPACIFVCKRCISGVFSTHYGKCGNYLIQITYSKFVEFFDNVSSKEERKKLNKTRPEGGTETAGQTGREREREKRERRKRERERERKGGRERARERHAQPYTHTYTRAHTHTHSLSLSHTHTYTHVHRERHEEERNNVHRIFNNCNIRLL